MCVGMVSANLVDKIKVNRYTKYLKKMSYHKDVTAIYFFFFKSVTGLMQNALWLKMHKKVNMTNYIGTRCICELGRDCYEGLIPQTDTVGDRLTPLSRTRNRVCIPFCWMAPTSVSSCHRPGLDGHISRVAKPPGKEHGTVRD